MKVRNRLTAAIASTLVVAALLAPSASEAAPLAPGRMPIPSGVSASSSAAGSLGNAVAALPCPGGTPPGGSQTTIYAVVGGLSCQLTSTIGGDSSGLSSPQTIPALYQLNVPQAYEGQLSKTQNYNTAINNGVLQVQNPAVIFQFPIVNRYFDYNCPPGCGWPNVSWDGQFAVEACLTSAQAGVYTNAQDLGRDLSTCPPTDEQQLRDWYRIASANQSPSLSVVQNKSWVPNTINIPVNFQAISTPIRFSVLGTLTSWGGSANVPPSPVNVTTPPINLIVLPAALIQLKVLPYSIVYMPPGNQSFGSLTLQSTYSTTMTAGTSTEIDNTNKQDDWVKQEEKTNANISKIDGLFGFAFDTSQSTKWDKSTTLMSGQSQSHDFQATSAFMWSDQEKFGPLASLVPGSGGSYAKEPFWSDRIIVLVHPQLALWDFYGSTMLQLIGASGPFGAPDGYPIALSDLDSCVNASGPYAAGYPIALFGGGAEILSAAECRNLAGLDPFWGRGQSVSLTGRGRWIKGPDPYGVPVTGTAPGSIDLKETWSNSTQYTDTATTSYSASVEEVLATESSQGMTLSGKGSPGVDIGFSTSITLSSGSSLSTKTDMKVSYKDSTATMHKQDVTVEGLIGDNANRGYQPLVEVYQDSLFGSLMYRDPNAPCNPMPRCAMLTVTANPGGLLTLAP